MDYSSGVSTELGNDAWLERLRSGADPEAQSELRRLVERAVRKAAAGRGDIDDAVFDDLTQVSTLRVLDNLDRFEGRSKFSTWAYSVAVRAAFSELRRPIYRSPGVDLTAAEDSVSGGTAPEVQAEQAEIIEVMHRVIAEELTERQRIAVLGELEGTPQEDLLDRLEINRNALYKLTHDARQKLRQGLTSAGICDDQVRAAFDL